MTACGYQDGARHVHQKENALPPTKLAAVSDFVDSISERPSREDGYRSIAEYAAEFGGTEFDLNPELQEAGLKCLMHVYEAEHCSDDKLLLSFIYDHAGKSP